MHRTKRLNLDGVAKELYVSAAAGTDAAWLILYTWWAFNKYVLSEGRNGFERQHIVKLSPGDRPHS